MFLKGRGLVLSFFKVNTLRDLFYCQKLDSFSDNETTNWRN